MTRLIDGTNRKNTTYGFGREDRTLGDLLDGEGVVFLSNERESSSTSCLEGYYWY